MDWNTIIGKLPDAVAGDDGINAIIFGVAEHWGYPLVGAAYNESIAAARPTTSATRIPPSRSPAMSSAMSRWRCGSPQTGSRW